MRNWKKVLEAFVVEKYAGVAIKWNGDVPTPVISNELENKSGEIIEYVTALWETLAGEWVTL